jgi:hypothetical protein
MTGIVTWAGLDVHARSTHAAAIDPVTGEVVRARFGPGIEGVGCINSIGVRVALVYVWMKPPKPTPAQIPSVLDRAGDDP